MGKNLVKLRLDQIWQLHRFCIVGNFPVICTAYNVCICIGLNVDAFCSRQIKYFLGGWYRNVIRFNTGITNAVVYYCAIIGSSIYSSDAAFRTFFDVKLFQYIKDAFDRSATCQYKMMPLCKHLQYFTSCLFCDFLGICQKCSIKIRKQNFGTERFLHLCKNAVIDIEPSISDRKLQPRFILTMKIRASTLQQIVLLCQSLHLRFFSGCISTVDALHSHQSCIL